MSFQPRRSQFSRSSLRREDATQAVLDFIRRTRLHDQNSLSRVMDYVHDTRTFKSVRRGNNAYQDDDSL